MKPCAKGKLLPVNFLIMLIRAAIGKCSNNVNKSYYVPIMFLTATIGKCSNNVNKSYYVPIMFLTATTGKCSNNVNKSYYVLIMFLTATTGKCSNNVNKSYRSGTVNSKFHLIRSFFEIFARFLSFHV